MGDEYDRCVRDCPQQCGSLTDHLRALPSRCNVPSCTDALSHLSNPFIVSTPRLVLLLTSEKIAREETLEF